mgnify:CR=1 FL=1
MTDQQIQAANKDQLYAWLDAGITDERISTALSFYDSTHKKQIEPRCPVCGGLMRLMTQHKTLYQFWGCRMRPQCNGKIDIRN